MEIDVTYKINDFGKCKECDCFFKFKYHGYCKAFHELLHIDKPEPVRECNYLRALEQSCDDCKYNTDNYGFCVKGNEKRKFINCEDKEQK